MLATGLFRPVVPGQVFIVVHDGLEKIKRVQEVKGSQVFVIGDNPQASVDSRSFGWLPVDSIVAKVFWPRMPEDKASYCRLAL